MNTNTIHTRPRWGLWAAFSAVLALLALLAVGMTRDPRELPSVLIGKPWPALSLAQLGGSGAPIGPAELRGKAHVINLWASWCGTCREEHPTLLELAQTLRAKGRADQLIGLNYKDSTADATAWLTQLGNPYSTSIVDGDGRLAIELGVYGAPETFVVDAKGIIVWKHVGALTPELIAREVLPRIEAQIR